MEILCNGEPVTVDNNCSLQFLMEIKGLHLKKGIAAAVNNTVIPKTEWASCALHQNDNILIITAIQGG